MEMGYAVFMLIFSMVLSMAFAPNTNFNNKPEAFEDIDFPQTEEGTPQAVIFGDCWSGDWTILGLGKYRTEPIRVSGGGKK